MINPSAPFQTPGVQTANKPRYAQRTAMAQTNVITPGKDSFQFSAQSSPLPLQPQAPGQPAFQNPFQMPTGQAQAFTPPSAMALTAMGTGVPVQNISGLDSVNRPPANALKQLMHQNKANIYAINIRTFGAFDKNHDGRISPALGENGTFLSSINRLDELQKLGINTIHLLPINPIGVSRHLGQAGSLYAPATYDELNPEFDVPGNNMTVEDEARAFVKACHDRGITVMVDVPSCASDDLSKARSDLILVGPDGKPQVPTTWVDIRMFKNTPALQDYYEKFFDLMANKVGVDGFRVDVARARTPEFWQHYIGKYPDKGWLAETYTEEDQSPLQNLPRDIPETLMRSGFDSIYGQFHTFHSMTNAKEYMDYLLAGRAMFQRASANGTGNDKSFISSFLTHDDPSMIEKGGALIYMLTSGLMSAQPWSNPYILDGFTTGYGDDFDIFNYVPRHTGSHPEIGKFLQQMLTVRQQYEPVLTTGKFIPIPLDGKADNQIIAFARQAQTPQGLKTLLIVANKDVNAQQDATLHIPGFSLPDNQTLHDLAPAYGRPSQLIPGTDKMQVSVGPGRFHMFEIDTPNLANQLTAY